jgi:galactose mutarotase-like enzyme
LIALGYELESVSEKYVIIRSWLVGLVGGMVISATMAAGATANPGPLVVLNGPGSQLRATIAPDRGGELVGLEYSYQGQTIELLYRGLDFSPTADWDGKAPILWPATGRNIAIDPATGIKSSGWIWNSKFYPIAIHGFARDLPWQIVDKTATAEGEKLTLSLGDNADTRKSYPFGFKITTDYIVGRNGLTIHQRVHAASDNQGAMPFSIGNHLTFKLPIVPGGDARAVTFVAAATRHILLDDGGRPTGRLVPFMGSTPHLVSELGTRKAVSLTGFPPSAISVKVIDPSGLVLTVSHHASRLPAGDPVLFNLWGDVEKGFFAPEPWVGKQNSLVTQDGVILLEPGANFEWTISITADG